MKRTGRRAAERKEGPGEAKNGCKSPWRKMGELKLEGFVK